MKGIKRILPVLLAVLLLTGCVRAEKAEEDAFGLYRQALRNETEISFVYYGGEQGTAKLENGFPWLDNVSFPRFALADVDKDGKKEVVVEISPNGGVYYGFLILRMLDSRVIGYELSYRGLTELKEDGTASHANTADDYGFGYLVLESDEDYGFAPIAYRIPDTEKNAGFYAHGEPISQDEYDRLQAEQDQKEPAQWYDLTEENIESLIVPTA